MVRLLDCPNLTEWRMLFDNGLSAEERKRYERHLESCPACQKCLDQVEELGDELRGLARDVGDPTVVPADQTLITFLERLHEQKPRYAGRPDPADLYFLRPADQPGLLGTLGGYEVREVIGQGGMGVVLKAYEPALHRLVAIKVMSPALAGSATARRRFTREAQAAAAVRHEHVVTVHGVHEVQELPYLVMQYNAGESLQERLDRGGPLEVVEVVRIGLQAAAGLAAAHAQGLIHRDIKPANLLLEDGLAKVKITDFGLARMADDVGLTQQGVIAGTPEYMSPEQANGESVDHRADLFSLGSVLYALCTGRPPFRGPTTAAVLHQVGTATPKPVRELNPEVPAWLEELITRLLAKDPNQRVQSAAELAALLEGYLAHLRQPANVPAPKLPKRLTPATPLLGSRGRQALLLVAVGLLVGLGLAQGVLPQNPPPAEKGKQPEFYQDFRGDHPWSPLLIWSGRDGGEVIEPEEKGLRVKLTTERASKFPCGVALRTPVSGDFEITAGYEIVQADQPRSGQGVGFELYLVLQSPNREALGFIRARGVDGQEKYCPVHNVDKNGRRKYFSLPIPIEETLAKAGLAPGPVSPVGQLRITRVKGEAAFWVAEGPGGEFRQVHRCQVGTEDVSSVRVAAYAGQVSEPVDVRFVDLRVRSDSLEPEAIADSTRPAAPVARGKKWLLAGLLFGGGVLLLFLVCMWWAARQRRQTSGRLAAPPEAGLAPQSK
jgi:serine/threonine protein kinase